MSSSASTSSSSDSEGPSRPPAPKQKVLKRKRQIEVEAPSDSEDSSSSSDSEPEEPEEEEDVPALSHAERRRQKKKEEKALKAETSPAKKRKLQDGSAVSKPHASSKKEKRQNSVWVGNLYFKTTPDNLRGFFDGVGEITRIHMPTKAGAKGENMGFAYVDFASPDHKVIAITLSERDFHGRRLLIKDGDDFSGRPAPVKDESQNAASADPEAKTMAKSAKSAAGVGSTGLSKTAQKILKVQKQPAAPTLFLGNLGFETTEKSIMQLFEAHRGLKKKEGDDDKEEKEEGSSPSKPVDKWIRKIRLGTFEDSGNCKGWAFVDFTSTEHATAALVNPKNHRLDGRNLVVEYASAEAVRRGGGGPRPKGDEGSGSGQRRGALSRGGKPNRGGYLAGRDRKGDGDGVREDRRVARTPKVEAGRQDVTVPDAEPEMSHGTAPPMPIARDHGARGDGAGYRGVKGRSKPGAALAMAKRESAAIVASKGQKITF